MKGVVQLAARMLPGPLKRAVKEEMVRRLQLPSMDWSLRHLRQRGLRPAAVVDIGAFRGEWTQMAQAVFPEAQFLMVEAQPSQQPTLEAVARTLGRNVAVRIALLGPESREAATLHQYDHAATAASVLSDPRSSHSRSITCPMVTLDQLLADAGFPAVGLLKLDVQGFELEVLKGARQTLEQAEAILLEVSLIALYQNNPLLHEVTAFMHDRGFCTYDVCSLVRRPLDDALCQTDLLFLREASPLRTRREWI